MQAGSLCECHRRVYFSDERSHTSLARLSGVILTFERGQEPINNSRELIFNRKGA